MWTKKCNPQALGHEIAWILYPPNLKDESEKRRWLKELSEDMYSPWKINRFKRIKNNIRIK